MSNFKENINGIEFAIGNTAFEVITEKKQQVTSIENKMHNHYVCELLLVLKGKITLTHERVEYACQEGQIICVPKLLQHISRYENATYFSVGFSMHKNKEAKQKTENTYLLFEKIFNDGIAIMNCTPQMEQFFEELNSQMGECNALSYYLVQNELRKFFILLSERAIKERKIPVDFVRPWGMVNFIINKRLCFENFENTKLKDLAKELFISERQLTRIIKQIYGVSFSKRKIQLRTETAKTYLEKSTESLETIASKLDFYDVASFIQSFKRETGYTPAQYRKMRTEDNKKD